LPDPEQDDEQGSARPFWSGTISFGLVSIPVNLYPANRSSHVGLRMLAPDGTPLRRRYYSAKTDRELSPDEMVRGYEIEKDQFVVVTDEELDKLAPEKSRDIDLRRFVNVDDIPPIYFERGYFLAPSEASTKAYHLLAAIMEKTRRAGLATFVMRGKEYLIAIVAENGILRAETMRFEDEIRSPKDVGLPGKATVSPQQVRRFTELISKRSSEELARDELHDDSAEALLEIAKKKQARKQDIVESPEAEHSSAAPADILAMLKKSLERSGGSQKGHAKEVAADGAGRRARAPHAKHPKPAKKAA